MRTLVIHPEDHTTDFLKKIYTTIQQKTVITGGITKPELKSLINFHDKVICLGHGSLQGLMAVGQFYTTDNYIIDELTASFLRNQESNIYIWCNADRYVQRNSLYGLYTGMFISEMEEAFSYGIGGIAQKLIDESNELFGLIVSKYIKGSLSVLYKNLINEYGMLARENPIARFNLERLYYKSFELTITTL